MNLDDSRIRHLVLAACPDIAPKSLEVSEMDYGVTIGFWHRKDDGTIQTGSVVAVKRTEVEVAGDIAAELTGTKAKADVQRAAVTISPYEGKRGKHPRSCSCSKHILGLMSWYDRGFNDGMAGLDQRPAINQGSATDYLRGYEAARMKVIRGQAQ